MESDKDMAFLVVKEQLTHFKIKKLIGKECKYPLHGGKSMWYIFRMLVLYLTNFGDYWLLD
jgi:hypothetical protein